MCSGADIDFSYSMYTVYVHTGSVITERLYIEIKQDFFKKKKKKKYVHTLCTILY